MWRSFAIGPSGVENETSSYRPFNEICLAHQTASKGNYTWRGTLRGGMKVVRDVNISAYIFSFITILIRVALWTDILSVGDEQQAVCKW